MEEREETWNDNILWYDASRNLLIFQREFGDIAEVVGKHETNCNGLSGVLGDDHGVT